MSSTGGYFLGLQTGSGSQNHVEDLFVWEMGGELEGFVGHLAEQEGGSPHRSAGKRQHVSQPSRHGRGFREVNGNGIFLEQLGQNPVCVAATRSILIIQPSK